MDTRDGVLGLVAFVLLAGALLVGMLWPVEGGGPWLRWAALLIGIGLQAPIYLLSPEERRPRVLAISLPLTFAFLVGFSWILEIFFPPASPNFFWLGLLASVIFVLAMFAFAFYLRQACLSAAALGWLFCDPHCPDRCHLLHAEPRPTARSSGWPVLLPGPVGLGQADVYGFHG